MRTDLEPTGSTEPIPTRSTDRSNLLRAVGATVLGRVRVPLGLQARPWATAYALPDGRVVWTIRLWDGDRAVSRVVGTETLRRYARANGLPDTDAALGAIAARAVPRRR